jgi:hypothetical protein
MNAEAMPLDVASRRQRALQFDLERLRAAAIAMRANGHSPQEISTHLVVPEALTRAWIFPAPRPDDLAEAEREPRRP